MNYFIKNFIQNTGVNYLFYSLLYMDYKNKYIKYRTKYLELKDINVNNQIGGGSNTNNSKFNEIVNFINKSTNKRKN